MQSNHAMTEFNQPSDKRAIGPDILRFIAVSLVILRHMEGLICAPGAGIYSLYFQKFVYAMNCGGWVGVDIFFVLSGFLVSGLIFREWQQRKDVFVGRFLLRRGLKIYPPFWFFLIGSLFLFAIHHQKINMRGLLGEILFLQNCWANLFNHTWSLAVEEHFYLLCAAGTWGLLRLRHEQFQNPFRFIPLLFLAVAVLCLVIRIVSNNIFPPTRVRLLFFGTHIRVDSLFFGVLLSYLWHFYFTIRHHQLLRRYRWALAFVGILLLTPMFSTQPLEPENSWIRIYGFILCYLAGGALLLASLKIFDGHSSPLARFVAFLGSNSYSAYLWHIIAISFVAPIFVQRTHYAIDWIAYYLIANVAVWVIGVVAARLVEFPVLKLRNRWIPSRADSAIKT